MTVEQNNTVKLSVRDWAGIIGVALTILTLVGSAFLTHDRLLMTLVAQQSEISHRLDKIEVRLENAAAHPQR
jgi:hypothetical protein